MHQQKPNNRNPTGVRDITIKMPVVTAQDPKGKAVTKIMKQPEPTKVRPGEGLIEIKSNAITARDGGICNTSAPVLETPDV